MPVYLSAQHFSALQVYGGWIAFVVLLLAIALYTDITKGQKP